MTTQSIVSKSHQQGAVLAVSLILLTAMTMLGLAGLQSTGLQTRMAGNLGDQNRAFQAAETALREGEQWVLSQAIPPAGVTACAAGSIPCDVWEEGAAFIAAAVTGDANLAFWQTNARPIDANTALASVSAQPLYFVERMAGLDQDDKSFSGGAAGLGFSFFRVTALGVGANQNSQVLLQSVVKTR